MTTKLIQAFGRAGWHQTSEIGTIARVEPSGTRMAIRLHRGGLQVVHAHGRAEILSGWLHGALALCETIL